MAPKPRKSEVIRRALEKGKTPQEAAEAAGSSVQLAYVVQQRMRIDDATKVRPAVTPAGIEGRVAGRSTVQASPATATGPMDAQAIADHITKAIGENARLRAILRQIADLAAQV